MARYFNSFSQAYRDSDTPLGYPYVLAEDTEPKDTNTTQELAARTADAILADVGDDAAMAQAALEAEQSRETPRTTLMAKLQKIVDASE